nr:dihydropteroate synthase [Brevibacterium jeotgali]
MGVLNITPDSFSDGGRWFTHADAVAHGIDLLDGGADIIDVGGESTRPGSTRVSEEEELARVLPVIRELSRDGAVISVDTMRESVARASLEAGATLINDVSAGQSEPEMLRLAAESGAPLVLMHWRGLLSDTGAPVHYDDTVREVAEELTSRIEAAEAAGVSRSALILDPGLGFSKNAQHNWELLARLDVFVEMGLPLLVAASRKRFLASLASPEAPAAATQEDRDAGTAAITVMAAQAGAWAVRVHEPRASRIAADAVAAVRAAGSTRS